MADYYTQCSVMIPYDSPEEFVWLENELRTATSRVCLVCKEDEYRCKCEEYGCPDEIGEFVFEDHGPHEYTYGRRAIWVQDDAGNMSSYPLVDLVARFQLLFDKPDFWECHFANSCSKPRLDAYSGFAVLVHRGVIHWFDPRADAEYKTTELWHLSDFEQTLPTHI